MAKLPAPRFRLVAGARALLGVLRDPNDTAQVFRLIDALTRGVPRAFQERFARSRAGARLLAERPDVLALLADGEGLARRPEGSLGRAYLDFMRAAGLSPEGLVEASAARSHTSPPGSAAHYIENRLRDTHDLWHVATGYGGDLVGEGALLAFTWAQTRGAGFGVLATAGMIVADDPDARRVITEGFVRGLRCAWLPGVAWEQLLDRPLDEVRHLLRLADTPTYEPFFAHELPPGGLLARRAA